MTVFAGHYGSLLLKRSGATFSLDLEIRGQDINASRKRLCFSTKEGDDVPWGTITTGDRIRLAPYAGSALPVRLYTDLANTTFVDSPAYPIEFFANVDAMGAIRMYRTFLDAINNADARYMAVPLTPASGAAPVPVQVSLLPGDFNGVGEVQGFTLSTDRDSVDVTALGDRYKGISAGSISGSGTVDCLFTLKGGNGQERTATLAHLVQRVDTGSFFRGKFYILEPSSKPPRGYIASDGAYYEVEAMITRSAFQVAADNIAECSFDFVTTGEFLFRTGTVTQPLTTNAGVSIVTDSTLEDIGLLLETN